MRSARAVLALLFVLAAGEASAVEGKRTPQQILAHDPQWLRNLGLEIPPGRLWSRAEGAARAGDAADNWGWPRHTGDFARSRLHVGQPGGTAPPGDGTRPLSPRHISPGAA